MKKSILLGGIAAMMLGMTACNGSGSSSADATFADSLATAFGHAQGSYYANMLKDQMPEDMRAKFNNDSFLRGLKQVLLADTADQGYLIGLSMGMQLVQSAEMWNSQAGVDVNRSKLYESFARSFKNPMDEEQQTAANVEIQTLMNRVQTLARQRFEESQREAQAQAAAQSTENREKGAAYIAEQKANDSDIKTTESGLSYKVIKQGTGAKPTDKDKAKVIYTGKLIDGTEFDSSNGSAVEFPVSGVVPGFSEALKMMNPGSKYIIYIPADLAYGDRNTGSIPPGSTLVFEVELTGFTPDPAAN